MDNRMIKAYSILEKGDIPISTNKETFFIPSQSGKGKYKVTSRNSWSCTCPDFKYRKLECKHILSIKLWLKLKQKISSQDTLELESEITGEPKCAYCDSLNVKKNGKRKIDNGYKQRYFCEDCKKTFVEDSDFAKLKANPKIVTLCMDLYYKGLSLRDITDTLNQFFSIKLHHETVRRWIMKFSKSMNDYVKNLKPELSDAWHVDEQMIKSKGKWVWSWNLLDDDTRFLIANEITNKRNIKDARKVFKNAKEVTNIKPDFIVSDGLATYGKAIRKEFSPRKRISDVNHIVLETIRAKSNNNVLERYHGTFREFDKIKRGFKGQEKALTNGFITYYNFIRPHMALNGLTPSQMAEINLNLDRNRWLSLLKLSLKRSDSISKGISL